MSEAPWLDGDNSQDAGFALYFRPGYASVQTSSSESAQPAFLDDTAYLLASEANTAKLQISLGQFEAGEVLEYDPTAE